MRWRRTGVPPPPRCCAAADGGLPLAFLDPGDYGRLPAGTLRELPGVRDALAEATCRLVLPDRGEEVRVGVAFSPRERDVLLDGGLLAHLRADES